MIAFVRLYETMRQERAPARKDAFADPLEGPEWKGLQWAIPLVSLSRSQSQQHQERSARTDYSAMRHVEDWA